MGINFLLIAAILFAVYKLADGYKRGMIKEIISLVSLVILGAVLALLVNGVSNYQSGEFFNVIVVVIALAILGVVHHLLGVVFFSAKMISKLPVIHFVNKLLGAVFGVLEVVFFLWTIYTLIMMLEVGAVGQVIVSLTEDSKILTWIYEHNWLAYGIERALEEFEFAPLTALGEAIKNF